MAAKKKPAPKRGASRYQAPAKKPVPGWVWLACGAAVGAFFMFLFSLEPGRDEVKRSKPEEQKRTTTQQQKPQVPAEPAKPKYDFYTLLPESEVIVPPDALPPADAPKPPEQKPVTPEEAAKIVVAADTSGSADLAVQKRQMENVAKLISNANTPKIGYLDPAAYTRTVKVLMSGGTSPVIKKDPGAAAMSHVVWEASTK